MINIINLNYKRQYVTVKLTKCSKNSTDPFVSCGYTPPTGCGGSSFNAVVMLQAIMSLCSVRNGEWHANVALDIISSLIDKI